MEGFKGTPGPWFYSGKHEECEVRYVGTTTEHDVVNEAAVIFNGQPEERQANANLIAAAPELLELVFSANGSNGCHTVMWQDKAKSVLEKALGQ